MVKGKENEKATFSALLQIQPSATGSGGVKSGLNEGQHLRWELFQQTHLENQPSAAAKTQKYTFPFKVFPFKFGFSLDTGIFCSVYLSNTLL